MGAEGTGAAIERAAFRVEYVPATIECDLDAMERRLEEVLSPYEGLDEEGLAKLDLKEAKACRADVNRIIKSVEDGRKGVKKAYNAPLAEFEARVKELLEPANEAKAKLDGRVREIEDERRARLREGLLRTYEDYAPALAEAVPFERIVERQWLNLSYGAAKAAEELKGKAAGIARDLDALRGLGLEQQDVAEREFFRSLSLQQAIDAAKAAQEEQARVDALKAQVDANRAAAAPEPEPEPGSNPGANADAEPDEEPETRPWEEQPRRVYLIAVEMTEDQKRQLMAFFRATGVHGGMAKAPLMDVETATRRMKEVAANGR